MLPRWKSETEWVVLRTVLPGPEIFFRPVHGKSSAKSGKSPANLHIKRKTAFSRRVNKIVKKFFSLSLSVRHYSKRRKFFQNISSATFLPLLTKFGHNSAINSSGQIFFSPAPFELFGRNFGHLATLTTYRAGFYYLRRSIERAPPGRPGTTSMKKGEDGVRARVCKTGYISLIFTAWDGSMISPAAPEDGNFIDIKKNLP